MMYIYRLLRFRLQLKRRFQPTSQLYLISVICIILIAAAVIWKFHLLNVLGPSIRKCTPFKEDSKAKINIGIVTFQFNSSNSSKKGMDSKTRITSSFGRRNHAAYATYQGYRIVREDTFPINLNLKNFAIVWAKVDVLRKNLRDFDWLVWIDSDVLIMNFKQRLETFIPRNSDTDIIISGNRRGINAGIFFWRNSPSGHESLDKWAKLASSETDEQKNLAFLIETEPNVAKRTRILPLCAFNSYLILNTLTTRYEYGDFAVHFAGSAWKLQEQIQTEYGWNLFAHFSELAGHDGITLKKWLGWRNPIKLLQIPWRP